LLTLVNALTLTNNEQLYVHYVNKYSNKGMAHG